MIGEPTGRRPTRPSSRRTRSSRTPRRTRRSLQDPRSLKTRVMFNSEWRSALGAEGLVRLCASTRSRSSSSANDFAKRFKSRSRSPSTSSSTRSARLRLRRAGRGRRARRHGPALQPPRREGAHAHVGQGSRRRPQRCRSLRTDGVEKNVEVADNAIGVTEPPNGSSERIMSVSDSAMWAYGRFSRTGAPPRSRR